MFSGLLPVSLSGETAVSMAVPLAADLHVQSSL